MTAPLSPDEAMSMLRIALAELQRKDAELEDLRTKLDQAHTLARNSMCRVDALAAELARAETIKREALTLCTLSRELVLRAEGAEDRSRIRSMRMLQDAHRVDDQLNRLRTLIGGTTA
jgi:hypothetical protein